MEAELPNAFLKSKRTEHRIRAENLAFDIDVWYPKVAKYTFKSIFLPLSISEALAIREFHNCTWRNAREKGLKCSELIILEELSRRIDHEIKAKFTSNGGGAFMRLCGRSPKDGDPLNSSIAIDAYDKECIKLGITPKNSRVDYNLEKVSSDGSEHSTSVPPVINKEEEGNLKMVAIGRATPSWLKVKSGDDALSLLLTSERVYADMIDWLNFGEPEQIVLREWEPELTTEYEFRVFVHDHQITAISQYDHYTAYPTLSKEKKDIKRAIIDSWKQLHHSVGESTYVADFAYLPSVKVAKLVELSPFLEVTGPALFHWKQDDALLKGKGLLKQTTSMKKTANSTTPSDDCVGECYETDQKEDENSIDMNSTKVDQIGNDDYVNVNTEKEPIMKVEPCPISTYVSEDVYIKYDDDDDGNVTVDDVNDDDGDGIEFRVLTKGHIQASELVESNWEQRWRSREEDTTSETPSGTRIHSICESGLKPLHQQTGFWDLLPLSQDLALHPKTKKKRMFVHQLSHALVVGYFTLLHFFSKLFFQYLKAPTMEESIAFLQKRRCQKLDMIEVARKQADEKEDQARQKKDDEKAKIKPTTFMETLKSSFLEIISTCCSFDELEVFLIDAFEVVYGIAVYSSFTSFISTLWEVTKFFFQLEVLRKNAPELLYYSCEQVMFMFEYFISILVFEFVKYRGPVLKHKLFVYGTLKDKFHWNSKYLGEHSGAKLIGPAKTVKPLSLFVGDSGVPYLILDPSNTSQKVKNDQLFDACVMEKHVIKGELWLVSDETLSNLDDYEGINKGYYFRQEESVELILNKYILPSSSSPSDRCEVKKAKSCLASSEPLDVQNGDSTSSQRNGAENKNEEEDGDSFDERTASVSYSNLAQLVSVKENEIIQAQVYGLFEVPDHLHQRIQKRQHVSFISEYTLKFHRDHYMPIRHIQVKQQKHLQDKVGTASES